MVNPKLETLREKDPRIVLVRGLLSKSEVKHLLRLAEGKYRKSTVVDNQTGDSVYHDHRTGELMAIGRSEDAVVKAIEERIASMTKTRPEQGEAIQVVKYNKGDQYKPHTDWFDPKVPGAVKQLKMGGQRICSVIMCLQQAHRGGETEFPNVGVKILLEPGDAVSFENIYADGSGNPGALHAGLPVRSGTKIIATRWIRQRHALGTEEEGVRLAEFKRSKEKACFDEVRQVLIRHGCRILARPGIEMDPQSGVIRAVATVDLEAVMDQ